MRRVRIATWGVTLFLFIAVLSLVACGKRGGPKPPETLAPAEVQFLTAEGTSGGIVLRWTAPDVNASGDELMDLAGFVVKRSPYVPEELPDYDDVATIPAEVDANGVILKREFEYRDASVKPGERYVYIIVGVNADGVEGKQVQTVRVTFSGVSSQIQVQ